MGSHTMADATIRVRNLHPTVADYLGLKRYPNVYMDNKQYRLLPRTIAEELLTTIHSSLLVDYWMDDDLACAHKGANPNIPSRTPNSVKTLVRDLNTCLNLELSPREFFHVRMDGWSKWQPDAGPAFYKPYDRPTNSR